MHLVYKKDGGIFSDDVNSCRIFLFLSIFNLPGDSKKNMLSRLQLAIETNLKKLTKC